MTTRDDHPNEPARLMLRRWMQEDRDLFAQLTQLRDEMRQHARNAFEVPGPDVITAPQVVRWADRLDQILSGDPEPQ